MPYNSMLMSVFVIPTRDRIPAPAARSLVGMTKNCRL